MNRCGFNAVSAGSKGQYLHAVVRILLQAVQNGLAGRRDLRILRVLIVPCVGGSVDYLK